MPSMRDIKRRKTSIQSTQQITKAMKLVSTVKLQRAKKRAESSRYYFQCMYDTVTGILKKSGYIDHPYMQPNSSEKKAVVVITSNRGLAGGYNSNVIKLVSKGDLKREDVLIYSVGKKGRDVLRRHGYEIKKDMSDAIEEPLYSDAMELSDELLSAFAKGEIGEIYVAYTGFKNTVSHIPTLLKLLPVDVDAAANEIADIGGEGKDVQDASEASRDNSGSSDSGNEITAPMNYEPDDIEALDQIIPKYVTSIIYGAFVQSVASENGARMQAMDSATNNAEEMIGKLELQYNRARQGHITQELTEIIGGADALN
ncbi:MAG: ATP synthase F1 subunit gamma [Lachnospiraceae bacterium]|nr:ATP synthase F1 subunit gamma [Lachnospiraceae bacterium]